MVPGRVWTSAGFLRLDGLLSLRLREDGRAQWKKIWIEKAGLTPAAGGGKGAALLTVAIAAWSSCVLPLDRAMRKPVIPPAGPMAKATTALPLPRGAGR